MSINSKMTQLANAVRSKTGETLPLSIDGMISAIDGLEVDKKLEPLYLLKDGAAAGPVQGWSTNKDGFHYGDNTYGSSKFDTSAGTLTMTTSGNTGYRHGFNTHTTNSIDISTYQEMGYKHLCLNGKANAIVGLGLAPSFAPLATTVALSSSQTNIWTPIAKAYPDGYAIVVYSFLNGHVYVPLSDLISKCNNAGINTADCKIVLLQVAQYTTSVTGTYYSIYFE